MPIPAGGGTVVTLGQFSTYLNNPDIDADRATLILSLAQTLCESVVSPLPTGSEVVILDVAERAYAVPPEGVGPFATIQAGQVGAGGLFLTRNNVLTLRRLNGGSSAFTIDTTPAGAGQNLPWWDRSNVPGLIL